jgi:hypothetical protein
VPALIDTEKNKVDQRGGMIAQSRGIGSAIDFAARAGDHLQRSPP